jgi:hypothetical protein
VSEPAPAPLVKAEAPLEAEPGTFAPPASVAPVYVAGVIGLGGLTTAIILRGIGANADRNVSAANDALARNGKSEAACATDATLASTCAALHSGERVASSLKTPFVASLAVGIGASLVALGWYFFAPKATRVTATGSGLILTY